MIEPETKRAKHYQKYDKVYEVEILFGVATDSYDLLGMVLKGVKKKPDITRHVVELALEKIKGEFNQQYPPYSSKSVGGKPLFWWARNDKLSEILIPSKKVNVYSTEFLDYCEIDSKILAAEIKRRIKLVKGDFRQDKIVDSWKDFFSRYGSGVFVLVKVEIKCSSGTYVRGIANDIGKKIGVGALAFDINRTKIGKFKKGKH